MDAYGPTRSISVRVAHTATWPDLSFDIEPWPPVSGIPLRPIQEARWTSSRAASISVATWASTCWLPWRSSGGRPGRGALVERDLERVAASPLSRYSSVHS